MIKRERRRPRVLYLSFYFPPSRASGVYRARATANHLAAHGWDVTVFGAPRKFLNRAVGSFDEKLAETVDPRIRIERPSQSLYAWERDLRRFGRLRRNAPVLAKKLHGLWLRAFPEHYASWGLHAVTKALRLHARHRFDVVLATGNPFASFAAAWLIHRLTGVPYIVDYRDSWTLDLFSDSPAYPDDHPAWMWEQRVLSRASAAIFVNDALRTWHAERYPGAADRMMVVPNGWDADLIGAGGFEQAPSVAVQSRPLRFAYLGTLTRYQPVDEMVEAFMLARRHPELCDAELNIHGHLGFFKGDHVEYADRLRLDEEPFAGSSSPDSGVRYCGPVPKTEAYRVYEDSDVLVFLAGGARYVTSGKIFEYMASGRPIVSVHAPGIAAEEVLQGYPLWFNAQSLAPNEVAESMIAAGKAARDLSPALRAEGRRHADAFARGTLLMPLEARLRSLVRRPVAADPTGEASR
jgi:glycosyltransferase involved in cell wall biosynthesis